jgi:hypothetical protein
MNAEAIANLIQLEGVVSLLAWAEGREYIRTNGLDGHSLWNIGHYRITKGQSQLVHSKAVLTEQHNSKGYVFTAAGDLVQPKDRNTSDNMAWCIEIETLDEFRRLLRMQGLRRSDNDALIFPVLPKDGWINKK